MEIKIQDDDFKRSLKRELKEKQRDKVKDFNKSLTKNKQLFRKQYMDEVGGSLKVRNRNMLNSIRYKIIAGNNGLKRGVLFTKIPHILESFNRDYGEGKSVHKGVQMLYNPQLRNKYKNRKTLKDFLESNMRSGNLLFKDGKYFLVYNNIKAERTVNGVRRGNYVSSKTLKRQLFKSEMASKGHSKDEIKLLWNNEKKRIKANGKKNRAELIWICTVHRTTKRRRVISSKTIYGKCQRIILIDLNNKKDD